MKTPNAEQSECGFTLIEMMIVVAILGILAAVAMSYMESSRQSAYNISAKHDLREFVTAQESYFTSYGSFVGNAGESIRNDGIASDFSVDDLRLSNEVVITVMSGDPADPHNAGDPFTAEAKHANSTTIYEWDAATNEITEK